MKLHDKYTPYYLCLALLLLITTAANAQNRGSKNTADSASAMIARKLSVSPAKAKQIQAAYSYKREDIIKLMKDTTLKGPVKMRLIKQLEAERRHHIDSTVTPAQKAAMIADKGDLQKKQMEMRAQILKRHEEEMNRIPHQRTVKIGAQDTTRKPKTKTH